MAVCGFKDSGKTTYIAAMLPFLLKKGCQTAVIKHDGHSFTPDVPGTDSQRFYEAGACGTAVFDGEKYAVVRKQIMTAERLAEDFSEADVILVEGMKDSSFPKLWMCRDGQDRLKALETDTVQALICRDRRCPGRKHCLQQAVFLLEADAPEQGAEFIYQKIMEARACEHI